MPQAKTQVRSKRIEPFAGLQTAEKKSTGIYFWKAELDDLGPHTDLKLILGAAICFSNENVKSFLHVCVCVLFQVILVSANKLTRYIEPCQLTDDFGGTLDYDHNDWLNKRLVPVVISS